MSCFNIPLELALDKFQNAHKKSSIRKPMEICDDVNSNSNRINYSNSLLPSTILNTSSFFFKLNFF
jgi:hypothetical protein